MDHTLLESRQLDAVFESMIRQRELLNAYASVAVDSSHDVITPPSTQIGQSIQQQQQHISGTEDISRLSSKIHWKGTFLAIVTTVQYSTCLLLHVPYIDGCTIAILFYCYLRCCCCYCCCSIAMQVSYQQLCHEVGMNVQYAWVRTSPHLPLTKSLCLTVGNCCC